MKKPASLEVKVKNGWLVPNPMVEAKPQPPPLCIPPLPQEQQGPSIPSSCPLLINNWIKS
ncbi:unnamed protein product [Ceratitis capitata]|uniref:(Mediterranean fruit fly) hypothetical protein n=1 Tax=Ceratitis capitata TaxID=7213 RepID=A0A811UVH1_CERCA|nr:unnamed protein product [Ceratitis capitata]